MARDAHCGFDAILYCHCGYAKLLPDDVRRAALERLCRAGRRLRAVVDLCALSARGDAELAGLASAGRVLVAACHERAVRWLLARAGAKLQDNQAAFLDLRAPGALSRLQSLAVGEGPPVQDAGILWGQLEKALRPSWQPWFPVIDYDRCAGCKQCLGFCLFGVYGLDAQDRVEVVKPANCKNNCPACARVCPNAAIIFPKYKAGPINGGEASEAAPAGESAAELSALIRANPDVYAALRARGQAGAAPRVGDTQKEQ